MERLPDKLSFEGAWAKQVEDEKENKVTKPEENTPDPDKFTEPAFIGQRDVVETRSEIRLKSKPVKEEAAKKEVVVVEQPSSKEGDDFDVEW